MKNTQLNNLNILPGQPKQNQRSASPQGREIVDERQKVVKCYGYNNVTLNLGEKNGKRRKKKEKEREKKETTRHTGNWQGVTKSNNKMKGEPGGEEDKLCLLNSLLLHRK
ncbi:hypothetical protein R3P38DRAFT_2770959 [Favolaschia claudopus]|uniref:Uncharacterized protein n=1 Tax=Favolaschia claudopus TaxID=2862362 RepID=A0AAW0CCP9_9AGAR